MISSGRPEVLQTSFWDLPGAIHTFQTSFFNAPDTRPRSPQGFDFDIFRPRFWTSQASFVNAPVVVFDLVEYRSWHGSGDAAFLFVCLSVGPWGPIGPGTAPNSAPNDTSVDCLFVLATRPRTGTQLYKCLRDGSRSKRRS